MDGYISEAEQIEQIKRWWKDNGKMIILAVIAALAIGFAWRYWQNRHEIMLEKSSAIYERLLNAAANNDDATVKIHADRLIDHYRHTPYAEIAALILARQAINHGELTEAETKLKWIMKHGDNKSLRQLTRIRVARVLLAERKPQEALDLLNDIEDQSYLSAIKEVTGDSYLQMGKVDDARKAYQEALKSTPDIEVLQPMLQMKIDNLPMTTNSSGLDNV